MKNRSQTVDAVYEHGIFRPTATQKLELAEGQPVRIVIEPLDHAEFILGLAAEVYAGLSDEEIDEIEKLSARRNDFFGERSEP